MDVSNAIDYDRALAVALRLVPPGPELDRAEAARVVAELREVAEDATGHVRAVTGMGVPAGEPPLAVVDRASWLRVNVATLRALLGPGSGERRGGVLARISAAEVGAMYAWLATRVLGQFDPFGEPRRLLLVAPNVVQVGRQLDVPARDFRLWVSLHEETHRVQFAYASWLAEHVRGQLRGFLDSLDLDSTVASTLRAVRSGLGRPSGATGSVLDLVTDARQAEMLDRIVATMSLIEGHADMIMDEVGPAVVPSVVRIRERFDARRTAGGWAGFVRRLLGMEAKMRQYAEGAAFCRAVVAEVGMSGLNHAWTSPNTLPTGPEIRDPAAWLARMGQLPRELPG